MKPRRTRFLFAAALLGLSTLAAPIANLVPAQADTAVTAASSTPRECVTQTDYAGRGDIVALCVYDDGRGNRFGRIAYRNPKGVVTVHTMSVALYKCQTGGRNCQLMGYDFREDEWLYYNTRLVAQTESVKASYGWVYQACGGVYATTHTDGHWFQWNGCTPFLPGAPKVSIITG